MSRAPWKKEAKLYKELFEILDERIPKLKAKQFSGLLLEQNKYLKIINKLLSINYHESNLPDTYLYAAMEYHSELHNFETDQDKYREIKKAHLILEGIKKAISGETIKDEGNIFEEELKYILLLEQDIVLDFARKHLEDAYAKYRTWSHTVGSRITKLNFKKDYEISEKVDKTKEGKEITLKLYREHSDIHKTLLNNKADIYRYAVYATHKDEHGKEHKQLVFFITGYMPQPHAFYLHLVVNPTQNKSMSTRMIGYDKNAEKYHLPINITMWVYRELQIDLKKQGISHLTTISIPEFTKMVERFGFKDTGWRRKKAFGTPFLYYVKRI